VSGRYPGTVYLLHFDRAFGAGPAPLGQARHYIGWAERGRLLERVSEQGTAAGSVLMRHVAAAGITWDIARLWEGGRAEERRIKRRGGASRLCPMCGIKARPARPSTGPEQARRPPWWPPIGAPRRAELAREVPAWAQGPPPF
jgi:hypothetical protein